MDLLVFIFMALCIVFAFMNISYHLNINFYKMWIDYKKTIYPRVS